MAKITAALVKELRENRRGHDGLDGLAETGGASMGP